MSYRDEAIYEKHTGRVLDRKTRLPIGRVVKVERWWEPRTMGGVALYDPLPTLRGAIVEVVRHVERATETTR